MRKAKVHLELNLARNIKDNKNGFSKYIHNKIYINKDQGKYEPTADWGGCPHDEEYRKDSY